MVNLPEPTLDYIRLLSIDPGTDTMGVSIFDISPDDYSFRVVYSNTFKASQYTTYGTTYADSRGHATARLYQHSKVLTEIMEYTQPTLICAESNFLKFGRVEAYKALVLCFDMILDVVWNYSPSMYLYRVDPVSAKNYVGVSHKGTDKEDVRAGVVKHLSDYMDGVCLDDLDEHSIDSIAIGHCFIKRELFREFVESTKKKKKWRGKRRKRKGKK